ncbi:hypothetical protein [Bradyrhizobium elkanii]|uniref:hypothetical protein n=1 Tax=Bradyrhizobium elkanii TaxID=29448 RepID=UPI0035145B7E
MKSRPQLTLLMVRPIAGVMEIDGADDRDLELGDLPASEISRRNRNLQGQNYLHDNEDLTMEKSGSVQISIVTIEKYKALQDNAILYDSFLRRFVIEELR